MLITTIENTTLHIISKSLFYNTHVDCSTVVSKIGSKIN